MNPKISVITSTYYRNDLVQEAIESVLRQNYEPVEIIVVDDSGVGNAKPVLEKYEEVNGIIRDEEGGWATAYTMGVEASTGDYIQFLDDDDYLLKGKLTKTADVLQKDPSVGVSYCGVIKGDDGKYYPKPEVSGNILEHALRFQTFPLWTGSMLMEREVLTDCLPLAEYAGDTDLKIELALRTEFDYVDECLAFYRRDESTKWVGMKKFREVKRVVRNQSDLYDQYPEIRRSLLSSWYERQGKNWLRERPWSAKATLCFLKAAYYADDDKFTKGIEAGASLLGRPGFGAAKRVRDMLFGGTQTSSNPSR